MKYFITLSLLTISFSLFGQKGKDGAGNITATGTQVNAYTTLTADATAGTSTITVASNALGTNFGANLAAGDLIFIYQAQGATLNGIANGNLGSPNDWQWGIINDYGNAGNFEFAEVSTTMGGSGITLSCALRNDYTAAGNVQVVRVPRYTDLTVAAGGSITCPAWNGATGGVLVVEVDGTATINGSIDASETGFRGGALDPSSFFSPDWATNDPNSGSEKGEGIAGDASVYDGIGGRYGRASAANGGGGGNAHNCGGGGGANGDNGQTFAGFGCVDPAYNAAWAQEAGWLQNHCRSGGGRGGYAHSASDQNALAVGPNNSAWGGDWRRPYGGQGARPLDYSNGQLFLGGGGGAGDQNDSDGGAGGNGGGLIYVMCYGDVAGSGTLVSNGGDGGDTDPSNPAFGSLSGNDGAGGAGAGGTIVVNTTGSTAGVSITADGGQGGDQLLAAGLFGAVDEAEGPGGGGGGGYIAVTAGTPTRSAAGGANGVTQSPQLSEFPPNGATLGAVGQPTETITTYFPVVTDDTVCVNGSTTLTASIGGTAPAGATINWYDAAVGGTLLGTGTTLSVGPITTTTTFWVGICPGHYRDSVRVVVSPPIVIDETNLAIVDDGCGGPNSGGITGILASGGTAPFTYDWNGNASAGPDLNSAASGTYTLTVTDDAGCTATSGPHIIGSSGGPTVDIAGLAIVDANCGNADGSITGITVTAGSGTYSYTWNGTAANGTDTLNTTAGMYTLEVTDLGNGCATTVGPFTINNNPGPVIDATNLAIANENCTQTNGSITGLTVSGGTMPYTYDWNGNSALGADSMNLGAGSYTLTVTDANGCTSTSGPHVVIDQPGPTIDASSVAIVDEHCGQVDGSITGLNVTGGTGPYTFDWSGNGATGADTLNIGAGSYTLTVTDANGCVATSGPHVVNNIAGPTIDDTNISITDENCGSIDGAITNILVSGGSAPLSYDWNGNSATGPDTINLAAGSYTFTVTDAFGCVATSGPYTVNSIGGPTIDTTAAVALDETCTAMNGSIIGVVVTSGSGNYSYEWNGIATTGIDTVGLAAGTYTLTVIDNANGCPSVVGPWTIIDNPPAVIDISNMVIADDTCAVGVGAITGITVSGGTAPLFTAWNGIAAPLDLTGQFAGNFTLTVTDANGCLTISGPHTINSLAGPAIDDTNVSIADENCGGVDGSITGITVSGGNAPISYDWNGNTASGPDTIGLAAGGYSLTVTDAFGCTATGGPYVVNGIGGPTVDTTSVLVSNENCGNADGSITGITATGSGTLTYAWNGNASAGADITGLSAGTYTLTVTDGNGCVTVVGPFNVTNIPADPLTVNLTVDNASGCIPMTSSFDATVAGGGGMVIATWTSSINGVVQVDTIANPDPNGVNLNWVNNFAVAGTDTICVTVADECGQGPEVSCVVIVTEEFPVADFTLPAVNSCDSATVTFVNNSQFAATYLWDFGGAGTSTDSDPTFTFTSPGTYNVMLEAISTIGCVDTLVQALLIPVCEDTVEMVVPNVFSPNADGQNDIFRIQGLPDGNHQMYIYNRWGHVIFQAEDYLNDWDGYTQSGLMVPEGTYYYILKLEDGTEFQGHVTLIR